MKLVLGLTSPRTKNEDVRLAQQLLQTNPWGQDYLQDIVDADFGEATARACKRAKYWMGYQDAKMLPTFGPDLRALLEQTKPLPPLYAKRREERLRSENNLPARALEIALSKHGIRESGGDNQVFFSEWYGMPGQPWCCMFVTFCYVEAGAKESFKRGQRWSFCFDVAKTAESGLNRLSITHDPKPGDVVVFGPPQYDEGHIGLFIEWLDRPNGRFKTIEGNTSDMVDFREQSISTVRAFVHVGG